MASLGRGANAVERSRKDGECDADSGLNPGACWCGREQCDGDSGRKQCVALLSRAQERTATAGVFSPTPWGSEAGLLPDHQQISDTDDLEFEFEFESEFELESESEPESD